MIFSKAQFSTLPGTSYKLALAGECGDPRQANILFRIDPLTGNKAQRDYVLHPVPANDYLSITKTGTPTVGKRPITSSVYLYDIYGNQVQKSLLPKKGTTLDISGLPKGLYIAKIKDATGLVAIHHFSIDKQ